MESTTAILIQLLLCLTGVMTQPLKISSAKYLVRAPHSSAAITCVVDRTRTRNNVIWTRRTGKLTTGIGFNNFLYDYNHILDSRYTLSVSDTTSEKVSYTLTINDLSLTDTAIIGCKLQDSAPSNSINHSLVVCEDPSSTSCKCLLKTGYLTPVCFEEPPSMKSVRSNYERTIYGLTACLVIVIIFGIVMALFVGRDCMAALNAKRKRELAKLRENGEATTPHGDREVLAQDTESEISDTAPPATDRGRTANQYAHLLSTHTHQNPAFAADETEARYDDGQSRYEEVDDAWQSRRTTLPSYKAVIAADVEVAPGARPKTNGYGNKPSPLVLNAHTVGGARDRYSPNRPHDQTPSPYQRSYPTTTAKSPGSESYHTGNHTPRSAQASLYPASAYPPRAGGETSPRSYPVRNVYTEPSRNRNANKHWRGQELDAQPQRLDFVYGHAQRQPDGNDDDTGPYIDKKDMIV